MSHNQSHWDSFQELGDLSSQLMKGCLRHMYSTLCVSISHSFNLIGGTFQNPRSFFSDGVMGNLIVFLTLRQISDLPSESVRLTQPNDESHQGASLGHQTTSPAT